MNESLKFNINPNGFATLSFDLKGEKVNKLSLEFLEELDTILSQISQNKSIKILIISSGKPESFIAGADLRSFEPALFNPRNVAELIHTGHKVFNKIEELPFPTIALVHGSCLGGGLELALSCTYRVVTDHPKTLLGLPEVSLGIFPGWGGTQRLPRLIGLKEGLTLILSGKTIPAYKAWKIKLADAILPWQFIEQKLSEFINEIFSTKGKEQILSRRSPKGWRHFLLEGNPLGRQLIFWQSERNLWLKTRGHYPANVAALKLVEKTFSLPLKEGLQKEAQTFIESISGPFECSKNLIPLFFTREALKKYTGVPEGTQSRPVHATALVGAGTMGGGLAWLLSNNNYPVRLKDLNWESLGKGYAAAHDIYRKLLKDKKLKPGEASLKFHHLSAAVDFSGFQRVDFVIEAIIEDLEIKKKLFEELEKHLSPEAIIASNTSSLTIAAMGSSLRHPERFIGMHFFNPPNRMPLVEVVPGPKTSQETIATTVAFCKKIGKTPLVVGDCHGFLVNRIFAIGANEVMRMLEEGVPLSRLEKMMLDFGMPMGPFALADEVGNDVTYKVSKVFESAYGERMHPPEILKEMYDRQLFGKKNGKGFYLYKGKKSTPNPEINLLIKGKPSETLNDIEMRDRVMFLMINEAARCLQEDIINNVSYLDMALIMGLGFPPFRGGLLKYADSLGIEYIISQLKDFSQKYGSRFNPCDYLLEMQRTQKPFYIP